MPYIAANFELGVAEPIDKRFVVQSESDLANLKVYEGLEVYIKDLKSKKRYDGATWVEATGGVDEEDVLEIIEDNSAEVEELDLVEANTNYSIATSTNYNVNSDTEVPTTKAVKRMIDATITSALEGDY